MPTIRSSARDRKAPLALVPKKPRTVRSPKAPEQITLGPGATEAISRLAHLQGQTPREYMRSWLRGLLECELESAMTTLEDLINSDFDPGKPRR